jgi:phosphatidylinositol-3-phosphatase
VKKITLCLVAGFLPLCLATPTQAASGPCGTSDSTSYQHVVLIVMDRMSYTKIIGSVKAPFLNSLASSCGLATNYRAVVPKPSLPDFLALTSGSTQGVTNDKDPGTPIDAPNIFGQVDSRSLLESMPSPCYKSDSGDYVANHNPQTYYADQQATCQTNDLPLDASSVPDLSARVTLVVPNQCHNMHMRCSAPNAVSAGDSWLSAFMPELYSSPEWQAGNTVVFVTWDEGTRALSPPENTHVVTLVVAPTTVPGTAVATSWNHYSLLATIESLLGAPCLANACGAGDLVAPFNL